MTDAEALARLVPQSDDSPHRAIIWVEAEVHELTPHGECSGMPKTRVARFPLYVDGLDRFICTRKLNETLEHLKGLCPAK